MSREDMKEIILRVIDRVSREAEAPAAACIFSDTPCDNCDATTFYGIGEEG